MHGIALPLSFPQSLRHIKLQSMAMLPRLMSEGRAAVMEEEWRQVGEYNVESGGEEESWNKNANIIGVLNPLSPEKDVE